MAARIATDMPKDAREVWRKVAQCIDMLNALLGMTVTVEGRIRMIGKLEVKDGASVLKIEEKGNVGDLGT